MSALLSQASFDLLADTFKQRPVCVGQPEVSRVDTSQCGTQFDEQGPEFPVHSHAACKRDAAPLTRTERFTGSYADSFAA